MPRCAPRKPPVPEQNRERPYDAAFWRQLSPSQLETALETLNDSEADFVRDDWILRARTEQLPPLRDWRIWLFLGGRGAGKTRSGAEWIAEGVANRTMHRIGLIGATFNDARAVMIEGASGLLMASAGATFEPSNRRIKWPGAVATVLSADEPDGIRGHQFDAIWADGDRAPKKGVKGRVLDRVPRIILWTHDCSDFGRKILTLDSIPEQSDRVVWMSSKTDQHR